MKKLSLAVIAISTAMLSTSCLREENFGKADSKFISLKVSTEGIAETKAGHVAEPIEVVDLSQDGLDLFLYGSVKVNKMSPFEPMTKAAAPYGKDDANNVKQFDIQMNNIAGYADRSERNDFWYIYRNGTTEKLTWEDETDPSYYLAYYPQNEEGVNAATFVNSTEVSYVGDGSKDFLVAYKEHAHVDSTYPSSDENYIPLTFKHPLALVNFHVAGDLRIPFIVIHNAATGGSIEINGEGFKCTPDELGDVWLVDNDEQSVGDLSIYLMPGEIGSDAINVSFYIDEDGDNVVDKILSTKNLGTSAWESGFIYNYTIADASVADIVDIEIEDEEEIVVGNEFTSAVFLRAAVVANWVDADGRIVEAWKPADAEISFNEDTFGWNLNEEDGYFYHKNPVLGYAASDALVDSITKKSTKDGLTLQICVAVQAVGYDHDKANAIAAWGEDIADLIGGLQ